MPCSTDSEETNSITTECVQDYKFVTLDSLDKLGHPHVDEFKLPAGCMCKTMERNEPSTAGVDHLMEEKVPTHI